MNLHQLGVLVCGALVALSCWYAIGIDTRLPVLNEPKMNKKDAVQRLFLDVPNIDTFDAYYGDPKKDRSWLHLNPFIPFALRKIEEDRIDKKINKPEIVQKPPVLIDRPPPPEPKPPRREWEPPTIQTTVANPPVVVGILTTVQGTLLQVHFGDTTAVADMRVGDEEKGWFLESIIGGLAQFRNADDTLMPIPLEVSGQMILALADGGGDSAPAGEGKKKEPKEDKPKRGLGQAIIDKMESTPEGKAALKNIPGLRQRILDNPKAAMDFIRQQNR